jgi:hypothetical protein
MRRNHNRLTELQPTEKGSPNATGSSVLLTNSRKYNIIIRGALLDISLSLSLSLSDLLYHCESCDKRPSIAFVLSLSESNQNLGFSTK